ncbi:MAG: hypothetical protein IJU47_02920 [Verrucomicrobia bacterium]|nr:hypothetical protein [Verrucomicrobiota bacterium]
MKIKKIFFYTSIIFGGLFLMLVLACVIDEAFISGPKYRQKYFEEYKNRDINSLKTSLGNEKTTVQKLALRIQVLPMLEKTTLKSAKKVQGAAGVDTPEGSWPRLQFFWIQAKPPVNIYAELQYEHDGNTKSIYAEISEADKLMLTNENDYYHETLFFFDTNLNMEKVIQENKTMVRLARDGALITYILPRFIYVWLPRSWTLKPVSDWFPVDFYEGNQALSIPIDEIDMDEVYGHLKKANVSYSQKEVEELINKMRSKNIEWKNILEKHSKIEAIKNKFLHLVEVGDTDTEDFKNRKLELKEALKGDFEELCNVACEIASELEERTPIDFVLELLEEADKIEDSAEKKNTDFYRAEIYYKVGNIEKGDEYAEKVHSNLENEFDMDFLKDIRDETIKNRMK